MQKSLRVIMGAAALGACLFLAPAAQAEQAVKPMAGHGAAMPDQACVAKHDADIKKCGKKKKCVAKHKKLKKQCPMVYKPSQAPYMMPGHPVPGQPMARPGQPYMMPGQPMPQHMMPGQPMQRPMPMMAPNSEVLERSEPQPTGKDTGVKTLPDNTYMPPWMK